MTLAITLRIAPSGEAPGEAHVFQPLLPLPPHTTNTGQLEAWPSVDKSTNL
jgi:hypothetical protein